MCLVTKKDLKDAALSIFTLQMDLKKFQHVCTQLWMQLLQLGKRYKIFAYAEIYIGYVMRLTLYVTYEPSPVLYKFWRG